MDLTTELNSLFDFLITLPSIYLLFFFGFSNFLENIFPPWPGDTVTVFSGFLASKPHVDFSLWELSLATLLGNWAGALLMFYSGKRIILFLRHSESIFVKKNYDDNKFEVTVGWFRKYSGLLIVFSRFSAGIRFFVAIIAGMSRMHVFAFLFYYTLAIFLWCGLLLSSGYLLGQNWDQINVILTTYNRIISVFLVALFIFFVIYYLIKKKEQS